MKKGFQRSERVADLIQKSIAQMLLEEVSDEDFGFVTITSVSVSRDLSYAKIYVSLLEEDQEKVKRQIDALNNASKSLRHKLAQAVKLRIVPELKFIYDESTARGFRISNLIDKALDKDK